MSANFEWPADASMPQRGGAHIEQLNPEPFGCSDCSESIVINQHQIPDRSVREQAETTFDRNVVIVAEARTSKTTLLVNRLVHLVVKNPHPMAISRIVALTFTNKTTTEIKVQLRERLKALALTNANAARTTDENAVTLDALRERYRLPAEEIQARADATLQDLEKAQINT